MDAEKVLTMCVQHDARLRGLLLITTCFQIWFLGLRCSWYLSIVQWLHRYFFLASYWGHTCRCCRTEPLSRGHPARWAAIWIQTSRTSEVALLVNSSAFFSYQPLLVIRGNEKWVMAPLRINTFQVLSGWSDISTRRGCIASIAI